MALYYDTTQYTSGGDLFGGLASVPNFWDSATEDTLTKGNVTLTYNSSGTGSFILAVGTFSETIGFGGAINETLIAATNKGLIVYIKPQSTNYTKGFSISCDKNGAWGAGISSIYTNITVDYILAEGLSNKTYDYGSTTSVSVNTQIIDLASTRGNFIFEDLRRVLYAPSAVRSFNGKLTMPNGEKYVKCGSLALRYTE